MLSLLARVRCARVLQRYSSTVTPAATASSTVQRVKRKCVLQLAYTGTNFRGTHTRQYCADIIHSYSVCVCVCVCVCACVCMYAYVHSVQAMQRRRSPLIVHILHSMIHTVECSRFTHSVLCLCVVVEGSQPRSTSHHTQHTCTPAYSYSCTCVTTLNV